MLLDDIAVVGHTYGLRGLARQLQTGVPRGQLLRLAEQTPINTFVTLSLVFTILVIVEAWSFMPGLYVWAIVQTGLILSVFLRWRKISRRDVSAPESSLSLSRSGLRHAVLWAALSGVLWGSLIAFLPRAPVHIQMGLVLVMGGMVAGASATLAAVPQVAIVFILGCGLPVVIYFLSIGDQMGLLLAFIFSIFLLAMLGTSRVTYVALMRQLRAEETSRRLRKTDLLREIAAKGNSAESVEEALQSCLDAVCTYAECSVGHVYLLANDGSNELVSSGVWRDKDEKQFEELRLLTMNSRFGPGDGFPGRVLQRAEPIWKSDSENPGDISNTIDEMIASGEFPRIEAARKAGLRAVFGFPIVVGPNVVGVIEFFSGNPAQPGDQITDLLTTIATLLGRTVERHQSDVEQRRIEKQLQQAQKMEAVGQLTSGIAHDFNNLLAVVMGNLELAELALEKQADIREYLSAAMHGVRSGADLNRQLLTFSKQQVRVDKITNVGDIVRGMLGLLKRTLGEEISIWATFGEQDCISNLDPALLESAILNLAINARDAMPQNGKLRIDVALSHRGESTKAVGDEGKMVRISMTDNGSGMTKEVKDRALEPFFTTKAAGTGSGLGLSMAHGFVAQAGGEMNIDSEPGKGTAIHMMFPMAIAADDMCDIFIDSKMPRAGSEETILVIEDQQAVRDIIVVHLEDLGYQVLDANDGSSGIEILESLDSIDLVLCDMILPGGICGDEVIARAKVSLPDLKTLYISGSPRRSANGGDDIQVPLLRKPFSKADLALAVRACLDQA